MDVHPIRTEADHAVAMAEVERMWGAPVGSSDADRLDVLVTLVEAYEARHHAVPPPDPVDAILFRLEQLALPRSALVPLLGSRSRVSEVLHRKRPLTLAMIRRLRRELGIPADVLVGEVEGGQRAA
ncbi:MAG: transcriptional regulator [Myxococcales bacterium]|nr:transcriptional regulator [Myxococcales bacterium]